MENRVLAAESAVALDPGIWELTDEELHMVPGGQALEGIKAFLIGLAGSLAATVLTRVFDSLPPPNPPPSRSREERALEAAVFMIPLGGS
jgi:hypothetical protein